MISRRTEKVHRLMGKSNSMLSQKDTVQIQKCNVLSFCRVLESEMPLAMVGLGGS